MASPPDPSETQDGPPTSLLTLITREFFSAALGVLGVYLSAKLVKRVLDPNAEARDRNRQRRDSVVSRLLMTGVPREALYSLSPAEETLLHDLVFPEDITTSFESVGGLSNTKETLRELIIYPLLYPDVYASAGNSSLVSPPKGILLYGPPGTGKTLLAKALAKESGANFLALSPSSLLSKWLGDTEQLARAVFSLARRVQPTIVFIDEIDGLFRERTSAEHEAHKNLKAEFMQLWDGLTTDDRMNRVVVLGATNRPYDVDPAILRRMPRPFEVALPNEAERVDILQKVLDEVELELPFDFTSVARATQGYSGSDLKELCRAAMMQPLREGVRSVASHRRHDRSGVASVAHHSRPTRLRALTVGDVLTARRQVGRTQDQSMEYELRTEGGNRFEQGRTGMSVENENGGGLRENNEKMMEMAMRVMQMLQSGSSV